MPLAGLLLRGVAGSTLDWLVGVVWSVCAEAHAANTARAMPQKIVVECRMAAPCLMTARTWQASCQTRAVLRARALRGGPASARKNFMQRRRITFVAALAAVRGSSQLAHEAEPDPAAARDARRSLPEGRAILVRCAAP